jgi:hypothetical protein
MFLQGDKSKDTITFTPLRGVGHEECPLRNGYETARDLKIDGATLFTLMHDMDVMKDLLIGI